MRVDEDWRGLVRVVARAVVLVGTTPPAVDEPPYALLHHPELTEHSLLPTQYIDPIVQATFADDGGLQDIVKTLSVRLRDDNTTVVFKSLIVLHTLMRSGSLEPTFNYLSSTSSITKSLQNQSNSNVSAYASFLEARIKSYTNLKRDVIRDKSDRRNVNRLRTLGVEKGLLREVRETQRMIAALVESKFYLDDIDDDVSMTALRLLTKDLLVLFQAVNEGAMNVLEHYFEMSHPDASTALKIYKTFCRDTEKVVAYLATAKKMHNVLNVQIPNLRHAPLSLVGSLEEYLNDPDFEKNREEYKENKRIADGGAPKPAAAKATTSTTSSPSKPDSTGANISSSVGPTSFTDFFESIEQAQQPMFNPATNSPSTAYFQQQQTFNPFLQQSQPTGMMPQMTGMPFGAGPFGGGPVAGNPFMMPQQTGFVMPQQTGFVAPQMTGAPNPFRQSMMPTGMVAPNPFQQPASPFGQQPFGQQQLQPQPTGAFAGFGQLQQQPTGAFSASPFAQSQPASASPPFLQPNSSPFAPTRSQSTPFTQPAPSAGVSSFAPPQRQQTLPSASPFAPTNGTSTGPAATALTPQKTGSRNPFAPPPGSTPPPPPAPTGPSMNMLAFNAFQQQQQQRQTGQQNGSLFGQQNGAVSQPPQQPAPQAIVPVKTGLMGNIASEFTINRTSSPMSMGGTNGSFAPNSSLSTPFSTLSVSTPPTSTPFSSSPFGTSTFSPSTSSALTPSPSELKPQPTGFGGSTMKPFQPTSSFGSKLADEMGPAPAPFVSSQPTGSPAFNPFRSSTLPPMMTGSSSAFGGGSGSGIQSQPTGAFGGFGGNAFGLGLGGGQQANGGATGSLI